MITVKWYIFSAEFNDDGTWFLCAMAEAKIPKKAGLSPKLLCGHVPGLSINVFEKHGPYYPIDSATKKLVVGGQRAIISSGETEASITSIWILRDREI